MKHPFLIALGCLLLGIGIGVVATTGLNSNTAEPPNDALTVNSAIKPPSKSKRGQARHSNPSGVTHQNFPSFSGTNEELSKLTLEEVKAKLMETEQLPPGSPFQFHQHSLYAHWATLDPEGAWEAVLQIKKVDLRQQYLSVVISQIAKTDLPTAQNLINGLKEPRVKQAALSSLVNSSALDAADLPQDAKTKILNNWDQ